MCTGAVPVPNLPHEPPGSAQHGRDDPHGSEPAGRGTGVRGGSHRPV